MKQKFWLLLLAGGAAGAVNGMFGAGGGMVLVPLLTLCLPAQAVFPASVTIILPICLISLAFTLPQTGLPLSEAWPYLLAGIPGGLLAGVLENKIPVKWLHRGLGLLILWGGVRYLW